MAALQSFKDKTLYICFSEVPNGYAIRSLSANTLIDQYQTPPPLKEVWCCMDDSASTADGCVRLGTNVYFVGGFDCDCRIYGENFASTRDSSKNVVGYNTMDGSITFVPYMTVKPNPIVFALGENLYVLSDPTDEIIPNRPFEVCNLSPKSKSKLWEQLPLPPFFDRESKYRDTDLRWGGLGCDCRIYGENFASTRDSSKNVVGYNTMDGSITFVPYMTVKPNPIVFALGENLYVLSDPTDEIIPNRPFEVCNLSPKSKSKLWEQLPLPPFFDRESKYRDTDLRWGGLGYAVIGRSFCVSNSKASFKFDIEKKIWEPCMLFQKDDDDDDVHPDSCGPPFGFYGQAVLFEDDILICMHLPNEKFFSDAVVAYKMVGGKVVRSQSFSSQGLPPSFNLLTSCIAHFGHGFFGIVYTEYYDDRATYELNVKLFHLNKKEEEDEEGFLHCELLNQFKYTMDVQIWNPIGFFVQ